jgi:hypothetical protein
MFEQFGTDHGIEQPCPGGYARRVALDIRSFGSDQVRICDAQRVFLDIEPPTLVDLVAAQIQYPASGLQVGDMREIKFIDIIAGDGIMGSVYADIHMLEALLFDTNASPIKIILT